MTTYIITTNYITETTYRHKYHIKAACAKDAMRIFEDGNYIGSHYPDEETVLHEECLTSLDDCEILGIEELTTGGAE